MKKSSMLRLFFGFLFITSGQITIQFDGFQKLFKILQHIGSVISVAGPAVEASVALTCVHVSYNHIGQKGWRNAFTRKEAFTKLDFFIFR